MGANSEGRTWGSWARHLGGDGGAMMDTVASDG